MSPRSEDFIESGRTRLVGARHALAAGDLDLAVSAAYYAMLYAARAALSEDDEYARSHGDTWGLFHRRYVVTEAFDQHLHAFAQRAKKTREQGDYEAITPAPDEAKAIVEGAGDFIAAVERMLAAG